MPPSASILETREDYHLSRYDQAVASNAAASNNSTVWIVSSIIGGVIVLVAIVTTLVLCYNKRSQYQQAKQLNPYLNRHEYVRKRKMSAEDAFWEEEQQRQVMIRKSLVARSLCSLEHASPALPPNPPPAIPAPVDQLEREAAEIERQESLRIKDDWKRWEASVRYERCASGEKHPAESGVPILAIPCPSKHRSQSRVSFADYSSGVPTPPPRHPGRPSAI
ncbi:hypothetical protein QBC42DRAFT_194032 [Cladorrhinum samala]|uniref:Uncharacterized protein n=1 Tax=Cladorrhinum samala TaxID=585594 RepID=A0AAV9I081_9PEZI|nr:hypothetical protein QBC42DRAFT_194032 [Cladorrhinum samala]